MSNHSSKSTGTPSSFYTACRQGDLMRVNRLLKTLSIDEINQHEPAKSNSTALHAASYYGHTEVVETLLKHGANMNIINGHNLTPSEEATKPEIKALFEEYRNKN